MGIVHIHHGKGSSSQQTRYRNSVAKFVGEFSKNNQIDFYLVKNDGDPLHSEAELREFRYRSINAIIKKHKYDLVVLAHQREDQLETRIIRLIRGTGPQGLVAMSVVDEPYWRPLLHTTRLEIKAYAIRNKLKWVEDPSNKSVEPMRNWVRHELLPLIESKRKGAIMAIDRSLQNLAEYIVENKKEAPSVLNRKEMLNMTVAERKQYLASYLHKQGVTNYSLSHINEILKRLNTRRKSFSFRVSRQMWNVDADFVQVRSSTFARGSLS